MPDGWGCGWTEHIIKCLQICFCKFAENKMDIIQSGGIKRLFYKLIDKMLCCTVSNLFNSFKIVLLSPKSTFMTSLFYILQYSVCLNTPLLFTPPPHPRSFGVLRSSAPELCHGSLATQKLKISSLLFYSG